PVPNVQMADNNQHQIPEADNALALLCWAMPDFMREYFRSAIAEAYERIPESMSAADKRAELAKLSDGIRRLEMTLCARAFDDEETLDLPEGVSPEAILGV